MKSQCFSGSGAGVESGTLTGFKHINEITNMFRMSERLEKSAELLQKKISFVLFYPLHCLFMTVGTSSRVPHHLFLSNMDVTCRLTLDLYKVLSLTTMSYRELDMLYPQLITTL